MTVVDTTDKNQTDRLTFELDLAHPPAKVWRALTDPALLAEWLLPAFDLQLTPGTAFRFQTQAYPGWDGSVQCRMLEIEAERKLSYSWVAGEIVDTVVTFTLAPTERGTHLSLVQAGFKPEQKQALGGARYGWKMMGDKLVALLERQA
jgi:uncharacterized protein YndB with AHSA1/START domain